MKWVLYNLLFAAVYPFLLPGFLMRMLKRGGYAARMGDRFALYPREVLRAIGEAESLPLLNKDVSTSSNSGGRDSSAPIWIHAVSVGEVQVAGQLMREWRKADPSVRFCFSTTSSTGWKIAEKELAALNSSTPQHSNIPTSDVLIYNPLDFPNFVKSALKTIRPRAIVLTESEIWPNFILQAKKTGIPLFLINARVSDRSAPRYKFARYFFKDVFGAFTKIFAQSDLDASRIRAAMGIDVAEVSRPPRGGQESSATKDNVVVTGSFKFDVAKRNEAKEKELREWIFGKEESKSQVEVEDLKAKILLGGSTWPGEDKVLLDIYQSILRLRLSTSTLLVLAPRHFEKADEVEANIKSAGFTCIRRSRGDTSPLSKDDARRNSSLFTLTSSLPNPPVYLCDTTGEMMGLFGICDVAFVGKSLCAHGSQNMIEPCLCGKPTFVGPYTENFRPVMSDLLASDAIVQVKDAEELKERIVAMFKIGEAAKIGEAESKIGEAESKIGEAESFPLLNKDVINSSNSGGKDSSAPKALGERAKAAVLNRQGVVPRCVQAIREELRSEV